MENTCTCQACGKTYPCDDIKKLCFECRTSDRHVFNLIRDYLYAFPGASINQVTEDTGISSRLVLKYLREGRLQTVGDLKVIQCEQCGAPISYGTLCEACTKKANHGFTSTSKVSSRTTSNVMHTKKKK